MESLWIFSSSSSLPFKRHSELSKLFAFVFDTLESKASGGCVCVFTLANRA
jgi:hypothetical protein